MPCSSHSGEVHHEWGGGEAGEGETGCVDRYWRLAQCLTVYNYTLVSHQKCLAARLILFTDKSERDIIQFQLTGVYTKKIFFFKVEEEGRYFS